MPTVRDSATSSALSGCYALSGTDAAYGATRRMELPGKRRMFTSSWDGTVRSVHVDMGGT
eukprot:3849467-Rhodomonas_salina.2